MDKENLVFKTGPRPDPIWKGEEGLKSLKEHLQSAVMLELSTIPTYLYAGYSLDTAAPGGKDARNTIMEIVKQEMLHLALAGNILRAVGGDPEVYGKFTPRYPLFVFEEVVEVKLELKAATKEHIGTFVKVTRGPFRAFAAPTPQVLIPKDRSIGEFYRKVEEELDADFKERGEVLFQPASEPFQFAPGDGSWFGKGMTLIKTAQDALDAMKLIVEQGEGGTGKPVAGEKSHWEIFKELEAKTLTVFPIVDNPVTEKFTDDEVPHAVMKACDATYSYLVLTIQKLWNTGANDVRGSLINNNLHPLMGGILRALSDYLVRKELKNPADAEHKNAAPPFNLYKFEKEENAYDELKGLVARALDLTKDDSGMAGGTIEDAMGGLVNLTTV